jgi:hypothetical protein
MRAGAPYRGRGVGVELLEGTPVLDGHQSTSAQKGLCVQQAKLRMLRQLFQHARHRCGDRQPFVYEKQAVDSHAN